MQPEELSKNRLYRHKKSDCDEKDDDLEEVMPTKTLHINRTLSEHYEEIMLYFITLEVQRIK